MRKCCNAVLNGRGMAFLFCAVFLVMPEAGYSSSGKTALTEPPELPGKAIVVTYNFERPSVSLEGGRARLNIPGLSLFVEEGKPVVPFKTAKILLPPSGTITDVEVMGSGQRQMEGRIELERGHAPQPTKVPANSPAADESVAFEESAPFPGILYELAFVQRFRGYRVAVIRLYPVQYVAKTGQVNYYETLTVTLKISSVTGQAAKAVQPAMFRGYVPDETKTARMVDNPDLLKAYPRAEGGRWDELRATQGKDETSPTGKRDSCDYLIITKFAFVPCFEPLLEWKMQKGLTGRIATIEEIKDSYEGADLQAKIRNFITECYKELGTEYVLLGGDVDLVPYRGVYGEVGTYVDWSIPCDLYYGCLDGTWDYDQDGVYGEAGDGEDGGEIDLVAEVYVGRATVSTASEASSFVKKTLQYEVERSPHLSYALWVGQMLDSKTWGSDSKEELVPLLPESFEVTRLYQKGATFYVAAVIEALNNSPHIVNHLGHSTEDMVLGMSKSDVDMLENDSPFFLYSQGCDAGAFNREDCIAEHFIKRDAGAFAVIANSRYGWYSPETTLGTSQAFDWAFLEAVFTRGITNLGKALQESKEVNLGDVLQTGSTRWCYFELNLLGDPETPLFTATSKGLLRFDAGKYSPASPVRLSVADIDLNRDPLVTETAMITLRSPGDIETIFALETTSNSGVFVAEVPLSRDAAALDGMLQVKDGDRITATYEDANDGSGVPRTVTATAFIDDSPPWVSAVKVTDVRDTWAVVEFQTNEPATARIDFGDAPPFTLSATTDVITKTHRVFLAGLQSETEYRFRVAATDPVGNETVDENAGGYYSFRTKHQIVLFSDNVEEGGASAAGEWSHEVVSGPVGEWGITTEDFWSETSCWHTDDFSSPSANVLDTPSTDLRGMTRAQLSFWHRMLSEKDWDGGFVQVQCEGREGWASLTQEEMVEGTRFVILSTGNPSGPVPGWSGNIPWERVTFDLSAYAGNRVRIRFRMESDDNTDVGEGDGWYIDDISVTRAVGTVNVDKRFYRIAEPIIITVWDASGNADPQSVETVSVEVSSPAELVPETVILTETGPDSSTFAGEIVTTRTDKAGDGKLGVINDGVITVSYGAAEPATATADLVAPRVSNVRSFQVMDSSATIGWQTDEECDGAVYYGTNPASLTGVAWEAVRGVDHELRLTGLQSRSRYYFKVQATDRAGNSTIADNSGSLYTFLTLGFYQAGVIAESTVWNYVEGYPYVINGSVYVGTGKEERPVILTIEPGVVVQFNGDKREMFVRGGIVAHGVTFEFDLPSGKSAHIILQEGSFGTIDNSVVSVSGSSEEFSGGIECYSSNVEFTNSIVRNAYYGFHCLSSSPKISGNTFIVCNYAVHMHAAPGKYCSPEITDNTFLRCRYPIFCDPNAYPVVAENAFEDNEYDGLVRSGMTNDTMWPAYDCPQFLTSDFAVPADRTLSIAPGATIRLVQPGADLFVSGNLYAEGATIEFAVPPEPGTFLTFASTSSGSIRNCRFVGKAPDGRPTGGIKCQSSAVEFSGNVISNMYYGVFCGPSKSPLIANNTIVGCEFGIYAPNAMPKITNCILWNNGDDLVGCSGTCLDTMDGDAGEGNISVDPLFRDAAAGDFRLQPASPCIDSGTSEMAPIVDASGYVRWDDPDIPNTGRGSLAYFDIGAYEFIVDADRDGTCDEWEVFHGLNPSDPLDASGDADGDGKSNREEYVAGTDPNDTYSRLSVVSLFSVEEEETGILIWWPTMAGRRYRILYADELAPPRGRRRVSDGEVDGRFPDLTQWKDCSDVVEGTGDAISFFDTGGTGRKAPFDPLVPRRFYRAVIR